jgi:hypothetical protein
MRIPIDPRAVFASPGARRTGSIVAGHRGAGGAAPKLKISGRRRQVCRRRRGNCNRSMTAKDTKSAQRKRADDLS